MKILCLLMTLLIQNLASAAPPVADRWTQTTDQTKVRQFSGRQFSGPQLSDRKFSDDEIELHSYLFRMPIQLLLMNAFNNGLYQVCGFKLETLLQDVANLKTTPSRVLAIGRTTALWRTDTGIHFNPVILSESDMDIRGLIGLHEVLSHKANSLIDEGYECSLYVWLYANKLEYSKMLKDFEWPKGRDRMQSVAEFYVNQNKLQLASSEVESQQPNTEELAGGGTTIVGGGGDIRDIQFKLNALKMLNVMYQVNRAAVEGKTNRSVLRGLIFLTFYHIVPQELQLYAPDLLTRFKPGDIHFSNDSNPNVVPFIYLLEEDFIKILREDIILQAARAWIWASKYDELFEAKLRAASDTKSSPRAE